MFLNRLFVIQFIIVFISSFATAQMIKRDSIKINELDEIIVTATRTVRQLSSLPMPVTLISKKQIKNTGSTRLKDILLEQTGIILVSDVGDFKGIQMQGLDAEYTMILIDGVPLIGRNAGNLDLSRVSVNNIKQIEIVKGPSSSLYGSEALGGVINIITESPKNNKLEGNISYFTRLGTKEELDINTNFLYKKEKFGVVAGVNLNSSGGFDLSPETVAKTTQNYQNFTANLKLDYDFSENLKFIVSQRFFYDKQAVESTQLDYNLSSKLTNKINDNWTLNYTFYGTKYRTKSLFNDDISKYNQTLIRTEIRSLSAFNNGTLISGIGANFDALDRTYFTKKETFNAKYIFAQYDFDISNKLNAIIGARFDYHNKYKSAFSPKISARYKLNNKVFFRGSVGFGFKAPDFRQLFFNFNNSAAGYIVLGIKTLHELYGNESIVQQVPTDLNPENSIGSNFGVEFKPTFNLKITANLFRNDINDLINTVALNGNLPGIHQGTTVFYYENRNKVFTQGIELDFKYKFSNNFKFIAGYQFLEAKDKEEINNIKTGTVYYRRTPTSSSEVLKLSNYFGLANRSKHTANAKLYYENYEYNFSVNLRGIFRSKYALYDTNSSQGIIDDFDSFVASNYQFNLTINKEFNKMIYLQFGIDNLLNERGHVNSSLFQNNDTVLILGRNYYGKMQFNF